MQLHLFPGKVVVIESRTTNEWNVYVAGLNEEYLRN